MIFQQESGPETDPTNYGPLRKEPPSFVIIHGTGLPADATSDGELSYLLRPNLRVSYHFYIRKDGRVRQLVPLENVGWHAGKSTWTEGDKTWDGLNAYSIGIGLESHNQSDEQYPLEQVQACVALTNLLMAIYSIPKTRVLTHRMISAPRKIDPVGWDHADFIEMLTDPT